MKTIKVRKIGNSVGIILPKELGLEVNDLLSYTQDGTKLVLDTTDISKEHDKFLIEESFQDFSTEQLVSEKEMIRKFGKYGWGDSDV